LKRTLLLTLAALGFTSAFIVSQQNPVTFQQLKETEECRQERINPSGTYTFEHDVKTELQNNGNVKIDVLFGLVANETDMRFQPYIFMGDQQIKIDEPAINLTCGDKENRTYVVPAHQASSLSVVFQMLPDVSASNSPSMIPESLKQYSTTSPIPLEREFDYAEDHTTTHSVVFKKPANFDPTNFEEINATILEDIDLRDGYLFDLAEQRQPTFVTYLPKENKTYKFGVYFSEVSPTNSEFMQNETDIYTITCLLNGKQFNAFNIQRSWSGYLYEEQAVVLEGQVDITQKGWNQLKCIALNNVYAEVGKESEYSHRIIATNIYLE
jgi:hypothetical protein